MKTAEHNFRIIEQIQDGRDFQLRLLEQNPSMPKTAEPRIRPLFVNQSSSKMTVVNQTQRGISLIELIIFIVIISVALAGILLVMNQTTKHSADPLIRKQAMAVAESLLEEIQLHSASGVETGTSRLDWTEIQSYNNYTSAGVTNVLGNAITGLSNYSVTVTIADAALHTIAATDAKLITVKVMTPQGEELQAVGYRANYEN